MSTIVTRSGKGSPLTHNEVDANFTNLNTDKYQSGDAATFTTLTATGQTDLGTGSAQFIRAVGGASAPTLSAQGSGTNIDLSLLAKGTGVTKTTGGLAIQNGSGTFPSAGYGLELYNLDTGSNFIQSYNRTSGSYLNTVYNATNHLFRTSGVEQARIAHTASAVNYVQVTGAATTAAPSISAQGSDAAVQLKINAKGGSSISFSGNGNNTAFAIGHVSSATNYLNVAPSATGSAPTLAVFGTDTNISMAFQSKGTGGISLSTGSTGTNLVNGTTVTAITRTAAGSNYTSAPSVVISAPTTAGGVQATATCTINLGSFAVVSGGTGYTVGDTLTLSGGTFTAQAQVQVSTVSAGVITAVTTVSNGAYTVAPSSPASVTGGTGTGATISFNGGVTSNGFTITNAGSGYVEQPTVTFSGGGGSGAAAYASVGNVSTIRGLYGGGSQVSLQFAGPAGTIMQLMEGGSGNPAAIVGKTSASSIQFYPSLTNCSFVQSSSGTAQLDFYTNTLNQLQFRVSHTASAVNYVQVTGAATGGIVAITAQGSDADIDVGITAKGNDAVRLSNGNGLAARFYGGVNNMTLAGSSAGVAPAISVQGSDTNIDFALTPKGTGLVRFGTYTAGAPTATGYISIKAADGTTYKVLVGT